MLRELVEKQRSYFSHFWDELDIEAAEQLLSRLLACEGALVFSGIGKSGLVAKKIALTMTSTGTKAFFLCPTNALHGDIGIVAPQDIFIMLSKSGESEELLHLVPFLRNRSIPIISWISRPHSRLAKASDMAILLPVAREMCPFDLVPTTSTAVQLIFGDMMAIALMSQRNFSLDQYALNHPAGRIGKRITMRVTDLMLTGIHIPICTPRDRLVDTLVELSDKRCGCILITDPTRKLLGIFTDGDLRRSLQQLGSHALEKPMEELMTMAPRTIAAQALAWEALQLMEENQQRPISVLPVISEEQILIGLIKMHDLIQSGI